MTSPESAAPAAAAEILEREIANTRRSPITTAAAATAAISGGLHVAGALQLWATVQLLGYYEYVPWALLVLGGAFIALGSRIYSQRLRALVACLALGVVDALATGTWMVLTAGDGFISLVGILVPGSAIATVALCAVAYGPCTRTAQARARAAAAGFDLDL